MKILFSFIIAAFILFFFIPPVYSDDKSDIQTLKNEIEKVKEELKKVQQESAARNKLSLTKKEKTGKKRADEILKASAERYILLSKDHIEIDFNMDYSYYSDDKITITDSVYIEHVKEHNLTYSMEVNYGLLNNLSVNARFPFVYKYKKPEGLEETDIGDISFGLQWQPFKMSEKWPAIILSGTFYTKTGKSQYEINPETELSTGSGSYSAKCGVNLSKAFDPLVAFGGLSYTYQFVETDLNQRLGEETVLKKVAPGDTITYNFGLGYALSYNISFTLQFQQSYSFKTEYWLDGGDKLSNTTQNSAMMIFGGGFKLSRKTILYVNLGLGLTEDTSDFMLSFRLPIEYLF